MRETIFKSAEQMPDAEHSQDVVRTATGPGDVRSNLMPATVRPPRDVENIKRPRRGHDY